MGARRRLAALAGRQPLAAVLDGATRVAGWLDPGRSGVLAVLTYHRVDLPAARPWLDPGLISASPMDFARQMRLLSERQAVVALGDVQAAFGGGRRLPRRAVLVTFDDAYRDFAEHAWPVLRELGLPVTLFVPTGFPDQPGRAFWWDRLHALLERAGTREAILETPLGALGVATPAERRAAFERLLAEAKGRAHDEATALVERLAAEVGLERPERSDVLGWAELRELAAQGVTLAPHSADHPLLTRVDPVRLVDELETGRRVLETELGRSCPPVLAYPGGAYDPAVVEAVRRAGYELAFTTRRGLVDVRRADPLRLPRINIGRRTTPAILRAQLLSWTAGLAGRPPAGS